LAIFTTALGIWADLLLIQKFFFLENVKFERVLYLSQQLALVSCLQLSITSFSFWASIGFSCPDCSYVSASAHSLVLVLEIGQILFENTIPDKWTLIVSIYYSLVYFFVVIYNYVQFNSLPYKALVHIIYIQWIVMAIGPVFYNCLFFLIIYCFSVIKDFIYKDVLQSLVLLYKVEEPSFSKSEKLNMSLFLDFFHFLFVFSLLVEFWTPLYTIPLILELLAFVFAILLSLHYNIPYLVLLPFRVLTAIMFIFLAYGTPQIWIFTEQFVFSILIVCAKINILAN
jgi:hypothetical protein